MKYKIDGWLADSTPFGKERKKEKERKQYAWHGKTGKQRKR
jgi:hypothetical protein